MLINYQITRQRYVAYRGHNFSGELHALLDVLGDLPLAEWQVLCHSGHKEKCFHVQSDSYAGNGLFVKYFEPDSLKKKVLSRFNSTAWHAFRMSLAISAKGIPTPVPVCYVRFRQGLHRGHELLCTEWLQNTQPLGPFADIFFSGSKNREWVGRKRELIKELACFVASLHVAGVYHGDFNINNILVRETSSPCFFLIDTGDVRTTRGISRRRVIKNLDEVNRFFLDRRHISHTDRMRFIRHYLERTGRTTTAARVWWRKIQKRTLRRLHIHNLEFIS